MASNSLKEEQTKQTYQMEYLDRGLVAVKVDNGVFISWRLLGNEADDIAFNLYRDGEKINSSPIKSSTNFLDLHGKSDSIYSVHAVKDGEVPSKSKAVDVWGKNYLSVPLKKPADGINPDGTTYTYHANDASVGDLDGDGQYEIVLKWDPSNSQDNSRNGVTGEVFVDAYEMDGSHLWRIGLGKNIRAGAHYTQFMVYDLDGDGKSEVALKTADGTTDAAGKVIGDPNADYRNAEGRVLEGPEFLSIFAGETGQELVTTDYEPARGNVTDWGDGYGNRVDRFLAGIAYIDGKRPSLIMARGYYEKTMIASYNYRDGELSKEWLFDSDTSGNEGYAGQGNHNLSIADVDDDGKDEIIYGAMAIDDDGTGLYTTGLGHGDAMHLGDLDPNHPGMEVFQVHESKNAAYGMEYRDADSGEVLWGIFTGQDTGRGMAADIDPRYAGEEVWARGGVYTSTGQKITEAMPSSTNFGIWWDGDLSRELLDHQWDATNGYGTGKIDKWDFETNTTINLLTAEGTASSNSTKGNPSLQADLVGDWREEAIWRSADNSELRIYTTTDVSDKRIHTLMHDRVYRLGVAWQNVAYNQPPHTSFHLGNNMTKPVQPHMYVVTNAGIKLSPHVLNAKQNTSERPVTGKVTLPFKQRISEVQLKVNGKIVEGEVQGNIVKFKQPDIINILNGELGEIDVTVSGILENGNHFSSEDTITIK
ncbi:rhamnogalacturonan lyase [Bacillus sp. SA1-12]|uniref:rhamnogalacturonan lyase n=1 Tax=Bacillus sp. SA1-12 TaxID=1455638 RepID=UPI001E621052|nr:rhamnogalacturonan lyase [Bacillus sp. SA1-12]